MKSRFSEYTLSIREPRIRVDSKHFRIEQPKGARIYFSFKSLNNVYLNWILKPADRMFNWKFDLQEILRNSTTFSTKYKKKNNNKKLIKYAHFSQLITCISLN